MKKLIYSLFALTMLFGMVSCEEKPVEGKPVLTVSTDLFVADGEEGVEFTVKVDDVDVTAESTIYVANKHITGNFFTTTEAKFYKAFATYNGQTSNKLSIQAAIGESSFTSTSSKLLSSPSTKGASTEM